MTHRKLTLIVLLSGLCLGACLDASRFDEPVGEQRHEQIMLNQLALRSILLNPLTGTKQSLELLVSQPLRTATFVIEDATDIGQQLIDDGAQMFMKYLVRCALAPEDPRVEWTHNGVLHAWSGQVGLCSAWATEPPTSECLELVSACMLAAENALGKSVATSQRGLGLDGVAIPTQDELAVKTVDDLGNKIASFDGCQLAEVGADRDCGWSASASSVGACTAGDPVEVQCGEGPERGVVRVCEGHTGCDFASQLVAAASMCGTTQAVNFVCPASGSYTVMVGGMSSGISVTLDLEASTGQFPASELEVFDQREGAYFGSLLDPDKHSPLASAWVDTIGQVHYQVQPSPMPGEPVIVHESMFACHDFDWDADDAYATERLCAFFSNTDGGQTLLCAAESLGACQDPAVAVPNWVCENDDVNGDGYGDFGDCTGNAEPWDHPITVFVDHPCDLASDSLEDEGICPGLEP